MAIFSRFSISLSQLGVAVFGIGALLILGFFFKLGAFIPNAIALTGCTERYTRGIATPSGFGAPFNVFSINGETIFRFKCDELGNVSMKASTTDSTRLTYVYKNGFRWNGAAWVPVTFTGTPVEGATDWLKEGATLQTAQADMRPQSVFTYFVAYTCTFDGGTWKCGCRDSLCPVSNWQIQATINPGIEPATTGVTVGTPTTGSPTTAGPGTSITGTTVGTTVGGQAGGISVVKQIPLDGIEDENVNSLAYVANLNGDSNPDFVFINAKRLIKAYSWEGTKLWEFRNPAGDVNGQLTPGVHFENSVVWDFTGDGIDDILHCWVLPGESTASIVFRNGSNGSVIDSVKVPRTNTQFGCAVAYFPMEDGRNLIFVPTSTSNPPDSQYNYEDELMRQNVYVISGNHFSLIGTVETPNAGHWYQPVDTNGNGKAELVMAGHYAITSNVTVAFELTPWNKRNAQTQAPDHVDSFQVGDIDPTNPGFEAIVAAHTQAALFSLTDGHRIGRDTGIDNAQWIGLGDLDATRPGLETFIEKKDGGLFIADSELGFIRTFPDKRLNAVINMDFDGDRSEDELLTWHGQVVRGDGSLIVGNSWFWNLAPSGSASKYMTWNLSSFPKDIVGDARDEIIVWGRRYLVVGSPTGPTPGALSSNRSDLAYRLRTNAYRNLTRSGVYFDYHQ